jgi:hypothetical protein
VFGSLSSAETLTIKYTCIEKKKYLTKAKVLSPLGDWNGKKGHGIQRVKEC